jgi:FixJ family two-component response regulator
MGADKQVAVQLGVSDDTVTTHIDAVSPKLYVKRMADMVRVVCSFAHAGA